MISIITVTYNSEKYIAKCIESADKQTKTSHEFIIVDNNSQDKTAQIIKSLSVKVTFLPQSENWGFGKANNLAFDHAKGDFVFFLNPDSQVLEHAIDRLYHDYQKLEKVGIVAPALIEPSGKVQPSVRRLPTIKGAINQYYRGIDHSYEAYVPEQDQLTEVPSVVGAALLMKRIHFERAGKFNPKYFMYHEDLELCKQITALGLKIYYDPKAQVSHAVGGSESPLKLQFQKDSSKKYHGLIKYILLYLILRLRPIK